LWGEAQRNYLLFVAAPMAPDGIWCVARNHLANPHSGQSAMLDHPRSVVTNPLTECAVQDVNTIWSTISTASFRSANCLPLRRLLARDFRAASRVMAKASAHPPRPLASQTNTSPQVCPRTTSAGTTKQESQM